MARDIGVRTPRLRGVVDVGEDSMLLAYEMIDGSSIDGVDAEVFTDDLMRQVWEQVAILRQHRIAHRDLRRANVFVQDDGVPWIIDFGFSELAVADEILDADVAQMIASFAVVVGAERAVRAAVGCHRSGCGRPGAPTSADGGAERRHPDGAQGTQGSARGRPGPGHRAVQRRERRVHPTPAGQQEDDLHRRDDRARHVLPAPAVRRPARHRGTGPGCQLGLDPADHPRLGDDLRRRLDQPRRSDPAGPADRPAVRVDGRARRSPASSLRQASAAWR